VEESRLENIGEDAFGQTGITSIELPASVRVMEDSAFCGCKRLTEFSFRPGCRLRVLPCAFCSYTGLKSIVIPDFVEVIERHAFRNCVNLVFVQFEPGSQLTRIGAAAFSNCRNLRKADLSECVRLQKIVSDCFKGTPLQRLIFPAFFWKLRDALIFTGTPDTLRIEYETVSS
jgi:hypothetical protein